MFKRANKITALLVAAAAIVSIVPATGVNAAERLGTKNGNINNAVAFKDGKYLYEGYRTDDDDNSYYFNAGAGEKDKEVEDAQDYTFAGKYSDKYVLLKDGTGSSADQYLVDLSNGKISDEDVPSDKQDTATTKLKTALKKTDMYDGIESTNLTLNKVDSTVKQFDDVWYKYTSNLVAEDTGVTTGSAVKAYGFTDESGKYVHASYIANMYVYSKAKNKAVKVEKYDDKVDGVTVRLKDMTYLAQDKNNFYTFTTVEVKEDGYADSEQFFIQKISKSQGDKEEKAYLPKDTVSYQLNAENQSYIDENSKLATTTIYDDGDSKDAYNAVASGVLGAKVDGNTIYVYKMDDSDTVIVHKINLKKVKDDVKKNYDLDGTTKVDTYLAKKDGDATQDVENGTESVSIDVDGNLWAVNKGSIYKFTGKDKKEMFTCDRSLDTLDVYNEGSLIAWEDGEDVYTTVQEGSAVTDAESTTTPAQTGWVNTATGWTFYDAAGKQVVGSWVNAGGVWYMMKADGIMATGWYNDNGTWYYLNASGAMTTGWLNNNGTWYYLQSSGAMKTGWLNDNGTWYYLNASGAMAANTTVDGYVLNASGAWVK